MNALIVDDEYAGRQVLIGMMKEFCPDVVISGEAESASQARELIYTAKPDLIFVDINMQYESGFDLLDSIPKSDKTFETIFVSGYEKYLKQAVGMGALGFLTKPVDIDELQTLVYKARERSIEKKSKELPAILQQNYSQNDPCKITTARGFKWIKPSDIIFCQAEGNYTLFICLGAEKPIVACGNLKSNIEKIHSHTLLRVHKSYMVNMLHVYEYLRDKSGDTGGRLIMINGAEVPVSKSHRQDFCG